MRTRPAEIDVRELGSVAGSTWGLGALRLRHLPVGGGSHHWVATDGSGRRHFVTVDDLDRKPWFGAGREAAFAGLGRAYATARALRDRAGLEFVVAPTPDLSGKVIRRYGTHHSVALFPFRVARRMSRFEIPAPHRPAVVALLAALHNAAGQVRQIAPLRPPGLLELAGLDSALRLRSRRWTSGPHAESARAWLRHNEQRIESMRVEHARLIGSPASASAELVLTHGEPHGGNLLRAGDDLLLVDWDTVALAPPERDLWLAAGDEAALWRDYRDATGREVHPETIRMYSLAWRLNDISAFVDVLRRPHVRTNDTDHALRALTGMSLA